jgi:hypothetical protein
MKPIKANFTEVINAVADGRGVDKKAAGATPKEKQDGKSKPKRD